ncbi:MAG: uracil-DNA glycosylase family protein [bacterium]|nr:uracil-DNA glycosylase family protein [bacterium]
MKIDDLKVKYDLLQNKYGDKSLDSIYNGGCEDNPDICFVFMNPTGRNIASKKEWLGRKAPWIGTKNIWKLFYDVGLVDDGIYEEIRSKKPKDWDYEFADKVYEIVTNKKVFITNLGKCTQIDARPLSDEVLKKYLKLLYKEFEIIKPRVIITFGNQVSSIVLNKKISVSENRKVCHELVINKEKYKVYAVYYPVGNGIFNIDKSIEDIKWIIDNEL